MSLELSLPAYHLDAAGWGTLGMAPAVDRPPPVRITLLPAEEVLRELLLDCRDDILSQSPDARPHLDMYIVGGWVRDRLLGLASSDIDIALSSMTGIQFSRALNPFAAAHRSRYQQRGGGGGELGVDRAAAKPARFSEVPQNPAMSKKLDTAVGRAFGLDVDLVNLRREVYDDEDSRKPSMTFGTAAEDAFRRDATINALFVSLETLEVLDFTGRGLQDLHDKVMRTPLAPRQTFLDDPLRVLRLIRIGSKLGFSIDGEALAWMKQEEVRDALDRKVKRERLSVETVKMLENADPQSPLRVIFETNLYATIFLSRGSSVASAVARVWSPVRGQPWPHTWPRAYRTLAEIAEDPEHRLGRLIPADRSTVAHSWDGSRARLWMMAIYAPVACGRHQDTSLKDTIDSCHRGSNHATRAGAEERGRHGYSQLGRNVASAGHLHTIGLSCE